MRAQAYWQPWVWPTLIAAAFLLMLAVNPVGYIGGDADDWQYLNAARCWREFGPCLPQDHWQSRWPVIAPLAAITAIFGESRPTVEFAPFLESAACLILLSAIGNRAFGRPVGWIAALLLIATPAFVIQALEPAVEPIELALILAGALAAMLWIEDDRHPWAFTAGLLLSLAVQVRETAVVAALLIAAFGAYRRRPGIVSLVAALGGFAIPFIVEFIWLAIATGDPLWRLRLAVRHTQLPSSELRGPIDRSHTPFFNKNYIAHWNFVPGVHVHWAVDGLINLFVNAVAGLSLVLVVVLAPMRRQRVDRKLIQSALSLWFAGIIYCCLLIYAFAIDPKPRMFMPALVCSNLALAVLTWSLWQRGSKALAAAIWITVAVIGTVYVYAVAQTASVDRRADQWVKVHHNDVETNEATRQMLTLVNAAKNLPLVGSGHSFLLYESTRPCSEWINRNQQTQELTIIDEVRRSRISGIHAELGHSLCFFKYRTAEGSRLMQKLLQERPVDRGYQTKETQQ